ncbi:DUF3955 domain-containing protein [Erysipelothrix urinaevulpis]|uniref:DUF3955 domain-containing protein n=1 Tax=Erysipelothrix urinaevulpis TaxID=2683717 RepID=UPI00135C9249|nr:DUF3955 domain-containing protein [Erysipelothrix urinaevulpis]
MKKINNKIVTIPFVLAIGLLIISVLNPAYVDDAGFLHEKFFLIPMTYMFLFIGIILVVYNVVVKVKK